MKFIKLTLLMATLLSAGFFAAIIAQPHLKSAAVFDTGMIGQPVVCDGGPFSMTVEPTYQPMITLTCKERADVVLRFFPNQRDGRFINLAIDNAKTGLMFETE